jgi:hypothetical protein
MIVPRPGPWGLRVLAKILATAIVLQGTGHAVLRTLYSRAHRIGLDGTSSLLSVLCKSLSFALFLAVVVSVLARPALEFLVRAKQKFECLGNDLGRRSVNELGIEF